MRNKSGLKHNLSPDKFYVNFKGEYKLKPMGMK